MERVESSLREHQRRYMDWLSRVVAQVSFSDGNRGVRECAELLVDIHKEIGFQEANIYETSGPPNVWAYYDAGKSRTLAVYAMFDHGPLVGDWSLDPFGAVMDRVDPFDRVMFGHGIATKGPYLAWLAAIDSMIQTGVDIPFNIACLLEGEEWVGSTHYEDMVREFAPRLENAIGAFTPSAGQASNGGTSLTLGSKGCAYFELISSGRKTGKGPVTASVHSSAQGLVHSPTWRLVEVLNTLIKQGSWGLEASIPGFYDDISLPEGRNLELFEAIVENYRGRDLTTSLPGIAGRGRVQTLREGLSVRDALLRLLYYPTLNINGIRAGYVGVGGPLFSLPGEAVARLDLRFAPDQHGLDFLKLIREYLDRQGFEDIELRNLGTHDWGLASESDTIIQAALRSYENADIDCTVWPMRAAGAPLGVFGSELGLPVLSGFGLGHIGKRGADQYMVLEGTEDVAGFLEAASFYVDFLETLGEQLILSSYREVSQK